MPCMQGAGCHRSDLTEDQRLPAAELHATVVFTQSCSSVAIGTNAYPNHIALGLGLLEGTAVAVLGALGLHVVQRSAQTELEAALAEGEPLGRIASRMARRAYPINGWMNRFGLLGDPGVVLNWPSTTSTQKGPATDTHVNEVAMRALAELNNAVLPRLERLSWLEPGIDVAEIENLRARSRTLAVDLQDPKLPAAMHALEADFAAFQLRTAAQIANSIYVRGWDYGGPSLNGMREVAQRPASCPNCGRDRAAVITLCHLVRSDLEIQTLQCRRCGDVWWTSETGARTITLDGPVDTDAVGGTIAPLTREIRNDSGTVLRGGVGFAFNMRKFLGLPPEISAPVRVAPFSVGSFTADVNLVDYEPRPDVHTGVFVAVVNGHYLASSCMMRLKPSVA
ncbi:hypothetical protein DY218_11150 [Streptomyces triticagri]|uniref:Uncharacterized protein n=2 Tax=Streptomyces triticagri TaxID=2293568 RepID=A0A372M6Z7_9ACTN|nr:hypothetical protein DY218_11150 [Streptomyces triticagri]